MALGSGAGSAISGLAAEKGRNAGASSSSSASSSDRSPSLGFGAEKRGRRVNARLRDMGAGVSESGEELLEEESALLDADSRMASWLICFAGIGPSDVLRLASREVLEFRFLGSLWRVAAGISLEAWKTVLVEEFCDA